MCTWQAIVDTRLEPPKRACVMCGVLVGDVYKNIQIQEVQLVLDQQQALLKLHPTHCVYSNLCQSALSVSTSSAEKIDELFYSCSCCHHWSIKRISRSTFIFPLQALVLHLQSMPSVHGKQLDTRVVFRLSIALCQNNNLHSNFFRTLFSVDELLLFEQIAAGSVSDVTRLVSAYIYKNNGRPLFFSDARITECIRRGEAHDTQRAVALE